MRSISFLLLLSAFHLLSVSSAEWAALAQDPGCRIYANASNGADNQVGSLTQPVQSLERAVALAAPGDRVCVAAGEYFRGADTDGTVLDVGSGSITLVLQSFAGESDILVSAPAFRVVGQGGTLELESGGAQRLVLSSGVLNTSLPGGVERLELMGADIALNAVDMTIGPGVDTIELLAGALIGTPSWEAAPRTVRMSGPLTLQGGSLPPLQNGMLLAEGAAPIDITSGLDLTAARLELGSTTPLTLTGDIVVTTNTSIVATHTDADLRLSGTLVASGSAGTIQLSIPHLTIYNVLIPEQPASAWTLALTSGRGILRGNVPAGTPQSPSPKSDLWPRLALTGEWTIGAAASDATLSTAEFTVRAGTTVSHESIEITGNAFRIGDGAQLRMQNASVILNGENLNASIDGVLLGEGDAQPLRIARHSLIALSQQSELSGLTLVASTARLESDGGTIRSRVTLSEGAGLDLGGNISGNATLSAHGSTVSLLENATWSIDRMESVSSDLHLPSGSQVTVRSRVTLDTASGFPSPEGVLVLEPGVDSLLAAGSTTLPRIVSRAANVTVRTGGAMAGWDVSAGRVDLQPVGNAEFLGEVRVADATFSVRAPSQQSERTFRGGMDARNAVLEFPGSTTQPIRIQGMLRVDNSTVQWPTTGISAVPDGILTFAGPDTLVLPGFTANAPGSVTEIETPTTIQDGLDLSAGRVIVAQGARLTVRGDLRRTGGRFEPVEGGTVRLEAPASLAVAITGFTTSVLPSLDIGPGTVLLDESATILGNLSVSGGTFDVHAETALSVSDSVRVSSGRLMLQAGTEMLVAGPFLMTGGELAAGDAMLRLSGLVRISSAVLVAGTPREISLGRSGASTLDSAAPVRTRRLRIVDGSTVTLASAVRVEESLAVETGASLVLSDTLWHLGMGDAPVFSNLGRTAGVGTLTITGPDTSEVRTTLSGDGHFGNLRIDLPRPAESISAAASTDPLRLSGTIDFVRGGLDPGGRDLLVTGTPTPILTRNMGPASDTDAAPAGRGFTGSAPIRFAQGSQYDLVYTGAVSSLILPGGEFVSGLVQSLTIDVGDAVNSPPVFGMQLTSSIDLPGTLHVTAASRLRLESGDIELNSPGRTHRILGSISGPGRVFVSASGIEVQGAPNTASSIDRLLVTVPIGSAEVILRDMGRIDLFNSSTDQLAITGTRTTNIDEWNHDRGVVRVSTSLQIRFAHMISGAVRLETGSDIVVRPGGQLDFRPDMSWEVTSSRPDDAFLTLLRGARVNIPSPVARVRSRDEVGTSSGPSLEGPLIVTEILDQGNTDINTNGFTLTLRDAAWIVGTGEHAHARLGPTFGPVSPGLRLEGTVRLELARPLRLSNLSMDADVDTLRIVSMPDGAGPFSVIVDGSASFTGGLLDMGANDIVLSSRGSATLLVDMDDVRAAGLNASLSAPEALLMDDAYGEFVLEGSSTLATLDADTSIPALRLERNTQLDLPPAAMLTVAHRLVFGENSATLTTDTPGRLRMADGAVLIRRGRGSLTHAPVLEGALHLAYDLDDGSVTGRDSRFSAASLTAGLELPPELESLTILAGNHDQTVNSVIQATPLRITHRLSVLSGNWITSDRTVTLAGDLSYVEGIGDADAPASWTRSRAPLVEGTINVDLRLQQSTTLGPDRLFGTAPLGSVHVRHMTQNMTTTLTTSLDVASFTVSGEATGTRFRLGGSSVVARDSITLRNVATASAPVALLESGGRMTVTGGSVTENVRIVAADDLFLEAEISNLDIQAGGSLTTQGSLFAPQRLELGAGAGTWTLSNNPQLPLLIRRGPVDTPFAIRSTSTERTLSVTRLELQSGSLELDGVRLRLDGPGDGFVRQDGHVTGILERPVAAGISAPIVFPLGTDSTFAPLTVTPKSGLLTETTITASIRKLPVHDRSGLPFTTTAGIAVRDADRRVWRISSTVNFANSLPFDISTLLPPVSDAETGAAFARSLIQRQSRSGAPWVEVNGTVESSLTSDGVLLRHRDASGMLTPSTVEIGVGRGELIGQESGSSQLVNLADHPVDVLTGASTMRLGPGQATPMLRAGVPAEGAETHWHVAHVLPDGATADTTRVPIAAWLPGGTSLAIVLPSATPSILASAWESTPLDVSDVRIFNAWEGGPSAIFSTFDTLPVVLGEAAPGEVVPAPVFTRPGSFFLQVNWLNDVFNASGFTLPVTGIPFRAVVAVMDSTAFATFEDGSVEALATATGVEEGSADKEPSVLPEALSIHPVYPNPVRGEATIPLDIPAAASVRVTIVDMLGREVRRVDAGRLAAGRGHLVRVDAAGLAAGTYLVVVEAAAAGRTWRETGTMTVLR